MGITVLAINGSPRKKSTFKALEILLENVKEDCEKYLINLSDFSIKPCQACNVCISKGKCIIEDDFIKIENKLLKKADILIIGSPVYFGNLSSQLKAFFDRTRVLRRKWGLKNKFLGAITVGRSPHGGQEHVLQAIHAWGLIHSMFIFSESEPTAHFGAALICKKDDPVEFDEWGKKTLISMAKKVDEIISLLKTYKARLGV